MALAATACIRITVRRFVVGLVAGGGTGFEQFCTGTDTAGSGRVPAALNNLVGSKASKGLLSTAGVVPACRTLDCVTFFTATAAEASHLLALCTQAMQPDERDEYSRATCHNDAAAFQPPRKGLRVGVPRQLEFLGCSESPALFVEAHGTSGSLGGVPVSIDFGPFLEAARLLYEGPWVAERYSTIEALLQERPEEILPVIRDVLRKAPQFSAVDTFRAQYRLQQLKAECDRILATVDCVVTPAFRVR
jgi:allophanate hydrolase